MLPLLLSGGLVTKTDMHLRELLKGNTPTLVLAVLKDSTRPLAVAAIRKRLGGSFTPQMVRRILERNAPKVTVTDDRPATYRLR